MKRCLLFALPVLALCTACGGGPNSARGIIIDDDGIHMAKPNLARTTAESVINKSLQQDLGEHFIVTTSIAENPAWDPIAETFLWDHVTAAITILGPTGVPLPVSTTEVSGAVSAYLKDRQSKGAPAPIVAITRDKIDTSRIYVVRAGDTLAKISAAYFGREDAWPSIVAANPDMDPANLAPGTKLVIPTQP